MLFKAKWGNKTAVFSIWFWISSCETGAGWGFTWTSWMWDRWWKSTGWMLGWCVRSAASADSPTCWYCPSSHLSLRATPAWCWLHRVIATGASQHPVPELTYGSFICLSAEAGHRRMGTVTKPLRAACLMYHSQRSLSETVIMAWIVGYR